jgi:uncharacterized protein
MIDDIFVIDAVTHAYDHTPANWADEVGAHAMVELAYALAADPPDPQYALPKDVYLSNWQVPDVANLLFRESHTDVAVHKAVPIGPIPVGKAYDPSDLENAATDFPELSFEIVHGGLAFLEETAWLLARFANIYVNMEIQNIIVERRPHTFGEILMGLCRVGGSAMLDRLFWGSGGTLHHPRPGLEAFMEFEFSEDHLEHGGLFEPIRQLTRQDKANMLSGTYAKLHGLDIDALKAATQKDEFARESNDPFPETWSTISLYDKIKEQQPAHA